MNLSEILNQSTIKSISECTNEKFTMLYYLVKTMAEGKQT